MFAYKGVLHAGKYYSKKTALSQTIKMTKNKIAQNKTQIRLKQLKLIQLEKQLQTLIDELNHPFLL